MIFPLTGLLLGAVFGAFRARARGGNRSDMAQWGAVFAMMFFVLGMFVYVILIRAGY